jgi:adenine/guanine phosphoribosyltransferase-like PRPP-binding protein
MSSDTAEPGPSTGWPWTEATTGYWQALEPLSVWRDRMQPPYRFSVPIDLRDGFVLVLAIRPLPQAPDRALASLIANQASLEVVAHLSSAMGALAQDHRPDVVIGLPTLGMVFAPGVAQALGHSRWVPLGYSRKFWYDDDLSTTVRSVTTPGAGKAIYVDPNQLSLIHGRRALIVDDVVSSAQTMGQVWDLLERLGVDVAGAVVAMRQGQAWQDTLGSSRCGQLSSIFDSTHLRLRGDGWWPVDTLA